MSISEAGMPAPRDDLARHRSKEFLVRNFGYRLQQWKKAGVGSVRRVGYLSALKPGNSGFNDRKFFLQNFGQMTEKVDVNVNDVRSRLFGKLGGDLPLTTEGPADGKPGKSD